MGDTGDRRSRTWHWFKDGALYKRDGINYLVVDEVLADEGIVKVNHEEWGVQPFGN